jgi:catechol 2,3-dioxygenase-like lactoylglutathione lyase family enzyme
VLHWQLAAQEPLFAAVSITAAGSLPVAGDQREIVWQSSLALSTSAIVLFPFSFPPPTFVCGNVRIHWPRKAIAVEFAAVKNIGIGATLIEHVAIIVTDLDRSKHFFADVLGLTEVPRPESFDFPGTWYQLGNTCLHLLSKPSKDTESPRHFCIRVPDLNLAAKHLESMGWPIRWESKYKIVGIDRFFLHDPDQNRIEIQGPDVIRE